MSPFEPNKVIMVVVTHLFRSSLLARTILTMVIIRKMERMAMMGKKAAKFGAGMVGRQFSSTALHTPSNPHSLSLFSLSLPEL